MKKYCLNNKKSFNCKAVITSDKAKIFGIISMTDIGIIYFSTLSVFLIVGLSSSNLSQYLSILFWCSVIPLPYTIFSLYYQFKVIKQLCILCLSTLLILWAQAAWLIWLLPWHTVLSPGYPLIILLIVIASITSIIYFFYLESLNLRLLNFKLSTDNYIVKQNAVFFNSLLSKRPHFPGFNLQGSICLGSEQASQKISVVLSLSCKACNAKFIELLKLADWFEDNINIEIILKPDVYASAVLKEIFSHTSRGKHTKAVQLLLNWYQFTEKAGMNKSTVEKWGMANHSKNYDGEIEQIYEDHNNWHKANFIPHTPFIVYNERLLPDEYYDDIDMLKKIIEANTELQEYET